MVIAAHPERQGIRQGNALCRDGILVWVARFDATLGFLVVATLFALAFFVGTLPRGMTLVIVTTCFVLASVVGLALLLFGRHPPE